MDRKHLVNSFVAGFQGYVIHFRKCPNINKPPSLFLKLTMSNLFILVASIPHIVWKILLLEFKPRVAPKKIAFEKQFLGE